MVLATHWLYYTHNNLQSKDYPVCGPLIWTRTRDTDADEDFRKIKIPCVVLMESFNFWGDFGDEEKLDGGFGPPSWSKCAVTFSDAGHYCGSISWYSDLLTRWWIQLFHFQDHGRLM